MMTNIQTIKRQLNGLSDAEILESFGEEIDEIAPRELRKHKKIIKEWEELRQQELGFKRDENVINFINNYFDIILKPEFNLKEAKRLERLIMARKNPGGLVSLPIEEARQFPILEITEFKKINKAGRRTMVSCPFHEDNSPSMLIDSKNKCKCFSCGFFGSSIDFVMKLYGKTFVESVRFLVSLKK